MTTLKESAEKNAAEIARVTKGNPVEKLGAATAKALERHTPTKGETVVDGEVVDRWESAEQIDEPDEPTPEEHAAHNLTLGESMAALMKGETDAADEKAKRGMLAFIAEMPPATFLEVSLDELSESPSNPRKTFVGLDELAASIAKLGLAQPIVVRPLGDRFQIVCGHRRARAAAIAGLQRIPATLRALSDEQAVELQIVENVKRENLTPLEEAEGYDWLINTVGMTVEQVSTKLGVNKATIYGRLKILELSTKCREALAAGRIPMSLGVPLTRAGRHVEQDQALKQILARAEANDGEVKVRETIEWLHAEYSRSMKSTPFSQKDVALVPEAGACTVCPYRTTNMPKELFDSKHVSDACTRPKCFDEKARAAWAIITEKAKADGAKVMSIEDGAKLFRFETLGPDSDLIELDTPNTSDPRKRSWRELMEKLPEAKRPQIVVAPDKAMHPRKLMNRKELTAALAEETEAKWAVEAVANAPKRKTKEEKAAAKESKAESAARAQAAIVAITKIAHHASTGPLTMPLWRAVYDAVAAGASFNDVAFEALEVEGFGALDKQIKNATKPAQVVRVILVLALLSNGVHEADPGYTDELKALAKAFGVDLQRVEDAEAKKLAAEAVVKGGK